jgi:hypothetical protein
VLFLGFNMPEYEPKHRYMLQREVAYKDTQKPTFYLQTALFDTIDIGLAVIECLIIYDQLNRTYPFIMGIPNVTRHHAMYIISNTAFHLEYAQANWDLNHTVHWWWRTPSNAGAKDMLIGFGINGIYELSR